MKYKICHPESPHGIAFLGKNNQGGDGLSGHELVGVMPNGLLVYKKKTWIQRLFFC